MNKETAKRISELHSQLIDVYNELMEIAEIEREKLDNLPENLNTSDMAIRLEENADLLDEWCDSINGLTDEIQENVLDYYGL